MKVIVQRVSSASVSINNKLISQINQGLLVFLGIAQNDNDKDIEYLIKKIVNLRIFNDKDGKMNLSVQDVIGEILLVSQFTLYANCQKGNRPSFIQAAAPKIAEKLYNTFLQKLSNTGTIVQSGQFQAFMEVELNNDGPVTVILESK